MPTFSAHDGTRLAYQVLGDAGPPVVCLPGGPMQAAAYLGDLGGLPGRRQLVLPDLRGTGRSAAPEDAASYRCDRLVDDVETLRRHLGLDRMDVLAHSAGANLAALYTGRHPERVARLALITPGVAAVGITVAGETRRATALLRRAEPWFPTAFAALERITAGRGGDADRQAVAPFFYGRWDEAARSHDAAGDAQRNREAAAAYAAEGAFDPGATRSALSRFRSPVLVLAGEADLNSPPSATAEYAALFPNAQLAVQPGAAHFPWLDDPDHFLAITAPFLT